MSFGLVVYGPNGETFLDTSTQTIRSVRREYVVNTGALYAPEFNLAYCFVVFSPFTPNAKFFWTWDAATQVISYQCPVASGAWLEIFSRY